MQPDELRKALADCLSAHSSWDSECDRRSIAFASQLEAEGVPKRDIIKQLVSIGLSKRGARGILRMSLIERGRNEESIEPTELTTCRTSADNPQVSRWLRLCRSWFFLLWAVILVFGSAQSNPGLGPARRPGWLHALLALFGIAACLLWCYLLGKRVRRGVLARLVGTLFFMFGTFILASRHYGLAPSVLVSVPCINAAYFLYFARRTRAESVVRGGAGQKVCPACKGKSRVRLIIGTNVAYLGVVYLVVGAHLCIVGTQPNRVAILVAAIALLIVGCFIAVWTYCETCDSRSKVSMKATKMNEGEAIPPPQT